MVSILLATVVKLSQNPIIKYLYLHAKSLLSTGFSLFVIPFASIVGIKPWYNLLVRNLEESFLMSTIYIRGAFGKYIARSLFSVTNKQTHSCLISF